MNQNKNEPHDTMSAGELLGKLKKNFSDGTAPTAPRAQDADQPTQDDLDIAALLKQYLPGSDAEQTEDAAQDMPADELPADEEPLSADALAEALSDEKTGAHFASLLDALEAEAPASQYDDDLPLDPMEDFGVEYTPEPEPAAPVSTVRRAVYRFRPSTRNTPPAESVKTVKVTETAQPAQTAAVRTEEDSYFAGRIKSEILVDDEPVLPDESAFIDLIPSSADEDSVAAETKSFSLPDADRADVTADRAEETVEFAPAGENTPEEDVHTEEAAHAEEPELDGTDINLLIALGYEDELTKTVGIDKVSEFERQLDSELEEESSAESPAFRGVEFTEKVQVKEIIENYKTEYTSIKTRLFGTLIMLAALFLYENVSLFGVGLPGALNMQQFPAVHTLISLQLLVLCGALSWRQLYDGIKGAFTLKPTPQSLVAVSVGVAVIYDLIIALVAPQVDFLLYNFPAALCLFILVFCDLLNLKREMSTFNILADHHEKFAVRSHLAQTENLEDETLTLDIRRADFIDGYFARTNRKAMTNSRLNYVLLPVVALAIALAIVSFSTAKSGIDALNIFVLTVLFCMPVSTLIASSYPLFRASQIAYEQDTAIIGESSIEEYSGANAVSFADKDIFPSYSVKLRSIKLYGNARPDLVLFAATSVFSKIGGPLADVLELATMEFDRAKEVELIRIAENGIEAKVDGVPVLLGRAEFLESYQIYPLTDADDMANSVGSGRILYIVMNGELSAKLYVQYDMDVDFEFTLRELAREDIAASIRTYDPNIDDDLLFSQLGGKQYNVRIEKQMTAPTESDLLERLDSGLVSRASAKSLIHTAIMCNRLTHVERTGGIIRAVALGVSLLIMLFLTLLSSSVGISSIYVALYQIFWMIPALIITHLFVK